MATTQSFANYFVKQKEALGLLDKDLTNATGLSLRTLHKIMAGVDNYRVSSLLAVADALNVDIVLREKVVVKDVEFDPMLHPRAVQGMIDKIKSL